MSVATAEHDAMHERLIDDGIEHLLVAYADYNGHTQGKSAPRSRFESTLRNKNTFAQANLGHNVLDIGAPTVNSYKRLLSGSWAPAHAAYAVGNRSSFVRIPGSGRPRIEVRSGDNTAKPYLFLAALLVAGAEGLREDFDPGPPAVGDLGHLSREESRARSIAMLPRTAPEALDAVAADALMREALGLIVFSEWLAVERSEIALYDTVVSPWERAAYPRT